MPRSSLCLLFVSVLACLTAGACKGARSEAPAGTAHLDLRHHRDGTGTKVATFTGDAITAEQVKQRLAEMNPYLRARYQTLEQRREYVDGLARFEMLAREAVERGLTSHPDVVMTVKRALVQRLIAQELDERPTPVSDEQVRTYYEAHKADYVKPEMLRLAHLFIARTTGRKTAEELLAKARALPPMDYAAFGRLVKDHSQDEQSKLLDGDLRFLTKDELASRLGPEVTKVADALTQVGQVAPVLAETPSGFHVLKLQGRQAALNLSLDQVKTRIQSVLIQEQRSKAYAALLDRLREKYRYEVAEDVLAKLEVDLKSPAVESKGPPPGFIPVPRPATEAPTR